LISPTDPIAVGAILKKSKIPSRLETIISGESMFNDAVGLILFITIFGIIDENQPDFSLTATLKLFAQEVIGGIAIGIVTGYIGYRLIKSITDFQTIFYYLLRLYWAYQLLPINFMHLFHWLRLQQALLLVIKILAKNILHKGF
jgi:CPA1 family monovalent cation:H+ antiporter